MLRAAPWVVLLSGCVVVPANDPPYIDYAQASCTYDNFYRDWLWVFEADVYDGNGALDVRSVDVHVYDEWNGRWLDSFPLDRTNDPIYWQSAWTEWGTNLYCGERYVLDFVADDRYGASDLYTVRMGGWF